MAAGGTKSHLDVEGDVAQCDGQDVAKDAPGNPAVGDKQDVGSGCKVYA